MMGMTTDDEHGVGQLGGLIKDKLGIQCAADSATLEALLDTNTLPYTAAITHECQTNNPHHT